MRNPAATPIRKVSTILEKGLVEDALVREGRKGCSPILSCEPTSLLPPYDPFDTAALLARSRPERQVRIEPIPTSLVTHQIFPKRDDVLAIEWQEVFLRSVSVFKGRFAFELIGNEKRVGIFLSCEAPHVAGVLATLTGIFAALRVRLVSRPFHPREAALPLTIEELVPTPPYHRKLSLIGDKAPSPLWIAYNAIGKLEEGTLGVYQVLFEPTPTAHDYHANVKRMVDAEVRAAQLGWLGGLDEYVSYGSGGLVRLDPSAAAKVEIDCATFAVVCRYFAWADEAATSRFLGGLRAATAVLRFGNAEWRRLDQKHLRETIGDVAVEHAAVRRLTHRPGLILTSHELASFFHLPNAYAQDMFESIEGRKGAEWQGGGKETQSRDLFLGTNEFAGRSVPVIVPGDLRLRHVHAIGGTGSGKSHVLKAMALTDAREGHGLCVVEPHGDVSFDLLARLPEERLADLVYLTFSEKGFVPRWNFFRTNAAPAKTAEDFARALAALHESWGVQIEHLVRNAAYTAACLRGCLGDLVALLSPGPEGDELRERARREISHPEVRNFWRRDFGAKGTQYVTAVLNKLSPILLDENLGAMFRQIENEVEPREWMDGRKIVVVNLQVGQLGAAPARFIGALIVSVIFRSALTRVDIPEGERIPFFLYLDECQDLQSGALQGILSEARKYGLGAIFSHQSMKQLEPGLLEAMGNCATRLVFRPVDADLPYLQRSLMGTLTSNDLGALGVGQAAVAVGSRVATVKTPSSLGPVLRDGREFARDLVRRTYLRTGTVEADRAEPINRRRGAVYDTFGSSEETP